MRKIILAGAMLAAFAAPGFAQPMQGPQDGGHWNDHHEWGGHGMMRGEHMQDMMHFAQALANGTFYRFKRGDSEVDIHCPQNIPLETCVTGAQQLMRSLPASGASTPGSNG